MPFEHSCAVCNNAFVADRSGRKFCSIACRGKSQINRETFECACCHKLFSVPVSATKKSNTAYCSRSCYFSRELKPANERFWEKVAVRSNNECWLWIGANAGGYGKFGLFPKTVNAHRFSYEITFGPIPDGLQINHKCDVRSCVNPQHLYAGTAKENTGDMRNRERGAALFQPGAAHHNARLNDALVDEIKNSTECAKEIAVTYGVTVDHIYAIRNGKRWG